MIRFDNVSFEYEKGTKTLSDISFEIETGESVGLIGANGAGKSTLMKVLLGLLPHEGVIEVDDTRLSSKNIADVRKKMGFVLQNSDNQMFMPTVYDDMVFAPLNYGISKETVDKKVDEVLSYLGITEFKYRHNHKLSGGEKRMAAIATILTMDPDILLMDEPTSTLDPYNRRKIINTINSIESKTKIITSHDLDLILDTCERVILISNGRIAADGAAADILADRVLLEANRMELPLSMSKK